MRHYEIVLMVHPDQSEQVPGMLERYRSVVEGNGGVVHRQEDWGRLQLAYTIAKLHKAHYLMINIECDSATLTELEGIFRFNDAILRHLTVKQDKAFTEPSVMMQKKEDKDDRRDRNRSRDEDQSSDSDDDAPEDADDTEPTDADENVDDEERSEEKQEA